MNTVHHDWLNNFNNRPEKFVDAVLRGVAHLPNLQRATPSEAFLALLGDLHRDAPEWERVDIELLAWLQRRHNASEGALSRPGGLKRFVRETGEGFRVAWRLELPKSCAWIHLNLFTLLRWANNFDFDSTFDLGRALLTAAAYVQQGDEFKFLWWLTCEEAASTRLRHRLDTALLGLAKKPTGPYGSPSSDLIVGLARWAARMPENDQAKNDVLREWRALKAAFPRQPIFWRDQWEAILEDKNLGRQPFVRWLRESDPILQETRNIGRPRRVPRLPADIRGNIEEMRKKYIAEGLSDRLWWDMEALIKQVERYAEVTGESYYFVTSCTNIAGIVMEVAPGTALALTRRALLWAPSDGHAWSVRATALFRLSRPDLAEAVLWEALRRIPSQAAFYTELALICVERGDISEAEALLRKGILVNPQDPHPQVELARVLWIDGRASDALTLLREYLDHGEGDVTRYMLGCLQIAEGELPDAIDTLRKYRTNFGSDRRASTLDRLISLGGSGQEEIRQHLQTARRRGEVLQAVAWDDAVAERVLSSECKESPSLNRIAQVARADLAFSIGPTRRDEALALVDQALIDDSNTYAQVVKGLAVPEYRMEMVGRTGKLAGSLPAILALTPDHVSEGYWEDLIRRFPEKHHLVRITQLMRGGRSEAITSSLRLWAVEPVGWDRAWDRYLKNMITRYLNGDRIDIVVLAHDALTQAVDVGMDAIPLAA